MKLRVSLTSIKQHAKTRRSDVKLQFRSANRANNSSRSFPTAVDARAQPPKRTRSFSTTSPIDRELLRTAHSPSRQGTYLFHLILSLIFPLCVCRLSAFHTPLSPADFSTIYTAYQTYTMSLQPPSEPIENLKDPGAHELPGVPKITGNPTPTTTLQAATNFFKNPKSPMTTSLMPLKALLHTLPLSLVATVPCLSLLLASRK